MIHHTTPLVLGSGSPRRREILQTLSIPIRVVPGQADEDVHDGEAPAPYLQRVVLEKLRDVAARLGSEPFGGLLVADTVVLLEDRILGKPTDESDARRMLRGLSGRAHEVHTRFAIALPEEPGVAVHEETVRTVVTFRALSEEEIARYAASGEGLDKAGAYAAQGLGSFAVARIEGSYPNVVGLPACEVVVALRRTGLLRAYPP